MRSFTCPTPRSLAAIGIAVTASIVGLASCSKTSGPEIQLSAAGKAGHTVYLQAGCATCHGTNGGGGVGPQLSGLFGTDVELDDGTTVIADESYLTTAISDPRAQQVKGYNVNMPTNHLTPEQVSQIVDFIKEIGPDASTTTATSAP